MTTIAFDGRYLAADTMGERGGNRSEHVGCKIHMRDGYVFAFGGYWGHWKTALIDWFLAGERDGKSPTRDVSGAMLVINAVRELSVFTHEAPFPDPEVFPFAIGTGGDLAMGAMGVGANAMEAVKVAMRWDIRTGGMVDFIDLEWLDKGVQRWDGLMPTTQFPMPLNTPFTDDATDAAQYAVTDDLPSDVPHASPWSGLERALARRTGVIGRADMCDHGYVRSTCSKC